MNSVLVLLKEVVLQKEIVFTQVCVYLKKKKILTLNHFLFLLLILGQNSVFKFSIASQSTPQIKAGKQSWSREVGEGFPTPALEPRLPSSESHRCPSPGGAVYELQGDGIVLSSLPVSWPYPLLTAPKAPPEATEHRWETIRWPKVLGLSFANGILPTGTLNSQGALWTKPSFVISVQKHIARVDSRQASEASSLSGSIVCGEVIRRIGEMFFSFKTGAPD